MKSADIPYRSSDVMVLRPRAMEILKPVLRTLGEFLPLECDGEPVSLFHCTNYIDALDVVHSEVRRFPSTGRIWRIEKHAFHPSLVFDQFVFRIPQYDFASPLLVTDHFRAIVEQHNLFGIKFLPIWSSDGSLVKLWGSSKFPELQLK